MALCGAHRSYRVDRATTIERNSRLVYERCRPDDNDICVFSEADLVSMAKILWLYRGADYLTSDKNNVHRPTVFVLAFDVAASRRISFFHPSRCKASVDESEA